jgi:hypothetical protein
MKTSVLFLALVASLTAAVPSRAGEERPLKPTEFGSSEHIRVSRVRSPYAYIPNGLQFKSAPILPMEVVKRGTGWFEMQRGQISHLLPEGVMKTMRLRRLGKGRFTVLIRWPEERPGIQLPLQPHWDERKDWSPDGWNPLLFKSKTAREIYF